MSVISAKRNTAVIITAKDAEGTAPAAVDSALAQSMVSEVVFVDDGSRDNTAAVAQACDDGSGRLKVIRLDQNRGPAHGRNVGIEASSAPIICILDADDFMAPDRIKRMLDAGGSDWDLLADNLLFTQSVNPPVVFDQLIVDDAPFPRDLTLAEFAVGNLPIKARYRRELGFLKPLIRRSLLDEKQIRYDERLRLGEDFVLYAECIISGGRFRILEACGYYAVQSPQSLSGLHRTDDIARLYSALLGLQQKANEVGQGQDIAACIQSTRRNLAVRQALDAKRQAGWPGFFKSLSAKPDTAPHVLGKLIRDKWAARPAI